MLVGTSDTVAATSLSNADLYDRPGARIEAMTVRASHAVEFWQRSGYTIVGVIPDAEGPGRPSIQLAIRL